MVGAPSGRNRGIFEDMFCLDTKRGPHSSGIAFINTKEVIIEKGTILPWDLLRSPAYNKIPIQQFPVMMGHNRFATKGAVTKANSHPFHHGHIILTHNGTLDTLTSYSNHGKFDTDSELLTLEIAEHGIRETYSKLHGGTTLVWWDQKERSLNAITNGQRPFYYSYLKGKKGLVYASEEWMFKIACKNRNVELEKDHFYLKPHNLITFRIGKKQRITQSIQYLPNYTPVYPIRQGVSNENNIDRSRIWPEKDTKKISEYGQAGTLVTEDEYNLTYGELSCKFCEESVKYEYPEATIIDINTIICASCTIQAEKYNVRLL